MLLEVLEGALLHSVREALSEDIGTGDITAALIPAGGLASATVISREPAVLCGMAWFNAVFAELDTDISVNWETRDGDAIRPGQVLCTLRGPAARSSPVNGPRQFLQTLSVRPAARASTPMR
jgi:nicotinate-nucleotide pyrophosphorylase (carboxylating)